MAALARHVFWEPSNNCHNYHNIYLSFCAFTYVTVIHLWNTILQFKVISNHTRPHLIHHHLKFLANLGELRFNLHRVSPHSCFVTFYENRRKMFFKSRIFAFLQTVSASYPSPCTPSQKMSPVDPLAALVFHWWLICQWPMMEMMMYDSGHIDNEGFFEF